ncbi:MAG: PTS sugar transporter subunit IIA [Nitrospinae bacterium]|nr:PTS sugar transporter subunit IIA [Nitrospinota bacterium]
MRITDYLTGDLVATGLAPDTKEEACAQLVDLLVASGIVATERRDPLYEKIIEREKLSSTGMGGGVAIPHTFGEDLAQAVIVFAQIPDGVEFESLDGAPVKLIFLIVGSERAPKAHLQILAMIVRLLKNRELVDRLTSARSPEEAYQLLASVE